MFLLFLVLYGMTAQRGPAWQDSGIFQLRIARFDLFGWLGLALSHPLLIVLGKAFSVLPFGPAAWRVNVLSSVAAALAAANVSLLVYRLVPRRPDAAWVAAGFFGAAHSLWWLATICESQALLVMLFTAELNVLLSLMRRRRQYLVFLLGLLNGLALTAHNLALLAWPGYVLALLHLCWRRRLPWRSLALFACGWLLGAGGLVAMVICEVPGMSLTGALRSALFGRYWQKDVLGGSLRAVGPGLGCVLYNYPNLALPLMVAGLAAMRLYLPRPGAWVFGYLALVYFAFAVRYGVPDQFMFFLPFYAMVSVLAGLAIAHLTRTGRRRWIAYLAAASVVVTPVVYAAAPAVWKSLSLPIPGRKDLPYRDPYAYWLCPWKGGEDSAGRFAREALASVPAGSVIIADGTSHPPLAWTQRVEKLGPNVRILHATRDADRRTVVVGSQNVFVVSNLQGYYPRWLDEVARLERDAPGAILFRVVWREASAGSQPPRDTDP